MAGQAATTPDLGWGNEEVAVRSLQIEVFGCRSSLNAVCGYGNVVPPEECDNGVDTITNASLNGFNRDCSIGCTRWNLPSCTQAGTCFIPPPPPPVGKDLPGKQEVGSTALPAWIKIAAVNFDELLRDNSDLSSQNATDCVNCPPRSSLRTCPGSLNPFLHPTSRRLFCGAPLATDYDAAGPAKFYIALPTNARAVGFRGRIVTAM